jgi:basic amino acid/polyamine antiporter, APA family
MGNGWQMKPGDRFFHPQRTKRIHLRRVLGVAALFSIGYGDVGSSIYYGLGVVAVVALGGTPIALAAAGLIYVFNALTYAEGSAMLPEGGGSASYARHGFNDFTGFLAGWSLMLSYIITMSISAYTIPPYLAYFWPALNNPVVCTLVSMGIIFFLMIVNIVGIKESSSMNILFIVLDIATQLTLVGLGAFLILRVNPGILVQHMFGQGNWPSTSHLIYGIALAALCFTGVESVSQHGEETRLPQKKMPQAYILMIVAVLVLFAGISIVALAAMTPQALGDAVNGWARDPVAGIAANLPSPVLRSVLAPLVSILAATILLTATNAGLLGISRLSYNLSSHNLLPAPLGRIHRRFRTPHIGIILFCMVSILMLTPGFFSTSFFSDLGALYVFGSLMCFMLAHASILMLRIKRPDLPRPFKLRLNIRFKDKKLPLTALLGLLATFSIWLVVIITQPYSRWAGFLWMFVGITVYMVYRWAKHLPIFRSNKPVSQQQQTKINASNYEFKPKHDPDKKSEPEPPIS